MDEVQPVATSEQVMALVAEVRKVHVAEPVAEYIVALSRATRQHASIELGASPRASLNVYRASQALAALRGRSYVIPDDVKHLVEPALGHRLVLRHEGRLRGEAMSRVLRAIVDATPVPVEPLPGAAVATA
jgi:MoxR-like ATPase